MTEQDHSKPTPEPAAPPDTASAAPAADAASTRKRPKKRLSGWVWAVILLIVLIIALGAGLWYQGRENRSLRADMTLQGGQATQAAQQAQAAADQARDQVNGQAKQIQQMRAALQAAQDQIDDLDQALQLMTDTGTDLLLLNDIDRLVTIAQQQLKLDGNVANAIISLEVAQARLARANRPALASLQQSINGDVDRLRAVVTVDLPALSAQLDRLYALLGTAPLMVPDASAPQLSPRAPVTQAPAARAPSLAPDAPWWQRAGAQARDWSVQGWHMLRQDLRGLFEVRRVDDTAALLVSPEQALRFREGLQQRTLTAQLALMMHQADIWRTELGHVAHAVNQRFDMQSPQSREARDLARSLFDTSIKTQLPTVNNSLDAIAAARDAISAQELSSAAEQGAAAAHDSSSPATSPPAQGGASAGAQ